MLASAPRLVEAAALNVEYSTFKQDRSRFSGAGFRDITFAVLFWVHLLAFCGYMGYRTAGIMQDTQKLPKFDAGAYVLVMSMSVGFGAVLAFVWLCLIRIMPKTIIYLSIALLGLLQLVICVLCFLSGQVLGGVLGGLGVLMLLVYVWVMRDSIELTAALMSATVGISKKYPGVLVISVIGLFMSILIFAFYAVTITALAHDVEDKDGKQQKGNLLLRVGAMFSLYWTTNVVAYVVHTTICGVVGRWYFVPEHTSATSPALKQSMSTSGDSTGGDLRMEYGKICLQRKCDEQARVERRFACRLAQDPTCIPTETNGKENFPVVLMLTALETVRHKSAHAKRSLEKALKSGHSSKESEAKRVGSAPFVCKTQLGSKPNQQL
eukprot:TRINITY_DN9246_c0_g1_i3.p1 TRINITY_DN9246_c0_g1~~TRINITY_DN9246_c0_g1_i3.p1  ORF type:complete len:380 (-),score=22.92 TRINITY_DN9246_c0_g1_i3:347-1486(-)